MASSTTRTGPGLRQLIERRAREAARSTIRTGWSIHTGAAPETVGIAVYNALGTDTIPARPTLEPTMRGMSGVIRAGNKEIVRAVNRGVDPTPLLDRLASRMADALRKEVYDLHDPPNAQSTIEAKGFDDPLVGADGEGRLVRQLASRRVRR